jgi:FkbM family methyltransferase
MISWNSFSTASKLRLARGLFRALTLARAFVRLPQVVIAKRRGVTFELHLVEGIDLAMYLGGVFEYNTHRALRRLINNGDTVLDIGANSGVHTLPMAHMVGISGRVIAFEPTNFAFGRLIRNLELNPDVSGRVTPVMAFLNDGSRNKDAPPAFYASWRLDGTEGRHPKHFGSLEPAAQAVGWTLDAFASATDLGRVAVIKLDVDGSECLVLRGATVLLERDHPAIVAEVCPYALEEHGDSAEAMLRLLAAFGYSFYDERTLELLPSDPKAIEASVKRNSSINILALSKFGATPMPKRGGSGGPTHPDHFIEDQRRFFDAADADHFFWQTGNPYVARTERELLDGVPIDASRGVLEVGCGEGGNIVNGLHGDVLDARVVGLDLFEPKVRFAKRMGVRASFVCGDALSLPFRDSAFDLVLCRDVLHHVADRERVLKELRRVCSGGGTVWIVEPNGRNPLMRLLATVRPHERGLLRNSVGSLQRLVTPHFGDATYDVRQPMPIFRLILHYQVGIPGLGRLRAFAAVMDAWDVVARHLVPRAFWAYVVIRARV